MGRTRPQQLTRRPDTPVTAMSDSRRSFLQRTAGALGVGSIASLSGCGFLGDGGDDPSHEISYGESVTSRIDDSDPEGYRGNYEELTFRGTGGEIVTITMTAESGTPYIFLEDPEGSVVVEAEGSGGEAVIERYTLPETGQFTIVATSESESASFEYEVELTEIELDIPESGYESYESVGEHTWENPGLPEVEVLVVGGGGGGGGPDGLYACGGGGGGGVIYRESYSVEGVSEASVVVGAGGANQEAGEDSTFHDLTAVGGGAGGASEGPRDPGVPDERMDGGCGGGGHGRNEGGAGTEGQGMAGGDGGDADVAGGGGGGGASQAGGTGGPRGTGGTGGDGYTTSIRGSEETFGGGGGGGAQSQEARSEGPGGAGGGGAGGEADSDGQDAEPNTGGGGGGGGRSSSTGTYAGGSGGSGVVVVKYNV